MVNVWILQSVLVTQREQQTVALTNKMLYVFHLRAGGPVSSVYTIFFQKLSKPLNKEIELTKAMILCYAQLKFIRPKMHMENNPLFQVRTTLYQRCLSSLLQQTESLGTHFRYKRSCLSLIFSNLAELFIQRITKRQRVRKQSRSLLPGSLQVLKFMSDEWLFDFSGWDACRRWCNRVLHHICWLFSSLHSCHV